jgi:hypothetical protein
VFADSRQKKDFVIRTTETLALFFDAAKSEIAYKGDAQFVRKTSGQSLNPSDRPDQLQPPLQEGEIIVLLPAAHHA